MFLLVELEQGLVKYTVQFLCLFQKIVVPKSYKIWKEVLDTVNNY